MYSPKLRVTWQNVLREIYTNSPAWYCSGDPTDIRSITDHSLAKKLGIDRWELNIHIQFLQKHELVVKGDEWEMTPKGFDIAMRDIEIKNDIVNRKSMLLATWVLAIAAGLEVCLVACL